MVFYSLRKHLKKISLNLIISRFPIYYFFLMCWLNLSFMVFKPENYYTIYFYLNEILNCSIFFSVFLLTICKLLNLCSYNWVASFGLLTWNILNVSCLYFTNYIDYIKTSQFAIMGLFFITSLTLYRLNK